MAEADHGKPRWMTLVAVLMAVVVVGIGAVLWMRYAQSPRRSLAGLSDAVQARDWDGVQRYVDVDGVASHFVDSALSTARGDDVSDAEDERAAGGDGAMSARPRKEKDAPSMKSVFVGKFREALRRSVEDATLSADAGGVSSVLLGGKVKQVTYASKADASVTMAVPDGVGGTQEITLRMRWAEDHWRIVALENVGDLLGSLN